MLFTTKKLWKYRKKYDPHALAFSTLGYIPFVSAYFNLSEEKRLAAGFIGGWYGYTGFIILSFSLCLLGLSSLKEDTGCSKIKLFLACGIYAVLVWSIFISLLYVLVPVIASLVKGEDIIIFGKVLELTKFGLLIQELIEFIRAFK